MRRSPALSLSYILAGAIGVVVIGLLILLAKKFFARKEDEDALPPWMLDRTSLTQWQDVPAPCPGIRPAQSRPPCTGELRPPAGRVAGE